MLPRLQNKSVLQQVKVTCFHASLPALSRTTSVTPHVLQSSFLVSSLPNVLTQARTSNSLAAIGVQFVLPTKTMPTLLLESEKLEDMNCKRQGKGLDRGSRKPNFWARRLMRFDRQWSLDLKRQSKGPETPTFPDGVPFLLIRKFAAYSGDSLGVKGSRTWRHKYSLKRGRRKLLK